MDVHVPEIHATGIRALLEVGTTILGSEQVHAILASLGVSAQELTDPQAWFSLAFADALIEQLEARTNDPGFLDKVASSLLSPKHLGPIYPLVRALGTPAFSYMRMVSIGRRLNKVGAVRLVASGHGWVRLGYSMIKGGPRKHGSSMCRLRIAQMAAVPTLFGMAPAKVEHPECMQRGDPACIYDIRWDEPRRRRTSWLALLFGTGIGFGGSWMIGLEPSLCVVITLSIGCAS